MLAAAYAALNQTFSAPFRKMLWKVLALTLALLAVLWLGLDKLALHFLSNPAWFPYPWMAAAVSFVLGFGIVVGLAFLIAPASSLVAGFYLDDLADLVEADIYPQGARGKALSIGLATWVGARFALVALGVNLIALAVFLLPGVNAIVFFIANAFLMGRLYFELAALRFVGQAQATTLMRRHAVMLFVAGLVIAAFLAVPILNLTTPLFGVAFMVRIFRQVAPPASEPLANPAPPQNLQAMR
ncbi:MAG: sulfate transporter family protein [Hyphomicrobiales bacterium]|nr:sulfate transporter family protein [Hyphomicrobiales bacterium]